MSDCCEKYTDFIAICSFLNVFGSLIEKKGENRLPKPFMIKNLLEIEAVGRAHRKIFFCLSLLE